MEYFFVQAEEISNPVPVIVNWYNKFNMDFLKKGMAYNMPKWTVLDIEDNPATIFTDIISHPFFLVSEMVKEIISIYDSEIEWKRVILFNQSDRKNQLYYIPILDEIQPNQNEKHIIKFDLDRIKDYAIFKSVKKDKTYIVIRLDLAESILRRDALGINLKQIEIV